MILVNYFVSVFIYCEFISIYLVLKIIWSTLCTETNNVTKKHPFINFAVFTINKYLSMTIIKKDRHKTVTYNSLTSFHWKKRSSLIFEKISFIFPTFNGGFFIQWQYWFLHWNFNLRIFGFVKMETCNG